MGRYLAAAGQAGLKPATTKQRQRRQRLESGAPSRGIGAGGFETLETATASNFIVITMAMRRPHQAGLKPATTKRHGGSVLFHSNHHGLKRATRGDESGVPSRGIGAGGFETRHYEYDTAAASYFIVITMALRRPHEVMKVGRRLAA